MPQAIATFVASVFATFGASATAAAAAGIFVAKGIVYLGIAAGLAVVNRALMPKIRLPEVGPESREVTVRGTVQPRQLVYGEAKTGGFLSFYGTAGEDNRYLWLVVVFAAHECEAITDLWLDGRHIPVADIEVDGEVTSDSFQGEGYPRLFAQKFLGTLGQTASVALQADFPSLWTEDHIGRGMTYVQFRLDRSETAFPTGAPHSFFALVKGRKLYDPRKDSTNGGSGVHRVDSAGTWEWSRNWALCVRDYISGGAIIYHNTEPPDKKLALGEDDARINDEYTIAAANISDEMVATVTGSPAGMQRRYTCDSQVSCGAIHRDNLAAMLGAGAGHISSVEGKYRIYAGAYDTPTITLTEDDILGPVEVSTHAGAAENYNFVTGTFFDDRNEWAQTPFPSQGDVDFETADGGRYVRNLELPATRDSYRAQRIAKLHRAQSRQKVTAKFTALSPKAMDIAEWETFRVTVPEYGWSSKIFRCLEWTFEPNGLPSIVAKEEASSVYADPSPSTYTDPVTGVSPPFDIEPNIPPNRLVTSDPYFQYDTGHRYWWHEQYGTGVTITNTGGDSGRGLLTIVNDGNIKEIWSRRTPAYPCMTGQQFAVVIRWRKTTPIVPVFEFFPSVMRLGIISTTGDYPPTTIGGTGYDFIIPLNVDGDVVEGEWRTDSALIPIQPGASTTPFVCARLLIDINRIESGTIEVSAIEAYPAFGVTYFNNDESGTMFWGDE